MKPILLCFTDQANLAWAPSRDRSSAGETSESSPGIATGDQEGTTQRRGEGGAPQGPGEGAPSGAGGSPNPAAAQPSCSDALTSQAPIFLGIGLIFYFMLIRPQQKQEKKRREMMAQLKKGDAVVTTAGLHGEVLALDANTVTLRVDSDVKLTFDRAAIHRLAHDPTATRPAAQGGAPSGSGPA
ncbi:MAG: preprotein translocase subunit YajC [Planctomycetes bacterium]|nr:preprotein translocase subunit YajC [Planctomycetota bacterium]